MSSDGKHSIGLHRLIYTQVINQTLVSDCDHGISAIFNVYIFTVLLTRKPNTTAIPYTNFTRNYFEMIEISCNFITITFITFKILLLITSN
jgi:hypothetical protein